MEERLRFKEKIGYSLTSFSNGCWSSFISTFLLYFYYNVAGIRPAVAGVITMLAVVWDAVNDPLFASMADNHHFKNGEKMRPLLIYASVPLAICLVLMFTVVGEGKVTVVCAFLSYFLFRIPSTLHNLPLAAMRQLATGNDEDRVALGTYSTGGGSLGMAVAAVALWPLIRLIAGTDSQGNMINPRTGFVIGAGVVGLIVIATSIYNYATTKERVKDESGARTPFITACRLIMRSKSFRYNLVLAFFYGLLSTLVSSYALLYCTDVLQMPALATPVSAMYILGVVAALPFVRKIYAKIGRKKLFTYSSIILLAGSAVFMFFSRQIFAPFVFCFCIGLGTEFASVLLAVNRADITDIIACTSGCRLDGMVGNVNNFIQKCATALLSLILGFVLEIADYVEDAEVQSSSAMTAIVLIMAIGGVISSIGMWIGSSRMKIDEEMEAVYKGGVNMYMKE